MSAIVLRSRVSPATPQILTLLLSSPRPHRLKFRVARRPCARCIGLKQSKRGARGLDGYALPPARAVLHERIAKQKYDAAPAARAHALTAPCNALRTSARNF